MPHAGFSWAIWLSQKYKSQTGIWWHQHPQRMPSFTTWTLWWKAYFPYTVHLGGGELGFAVEHPVEGQLDISLASWLWTFPNYKRRKESCFTRFKPGNKLGGVHIELLIFVFIKYSYLAILSRKKKQHRLFHLSRKGEDTKEGRLTDWF